MPHPTDLDWQAGVISIKDLQLVADKGARLGLDVERWGSAEHTEASLTWTGLELAWLQPYTDFTVGTGHSNGQVQFAASAGRPVSIRGEVSAKGRVEEEYFELDYDALELNFVWDQGGLQLSGTAQSPTGEGLQVKASAPGVPDWNWSFEGLVADLKWQALNLARLNRFLEGGQLEGSSEGSLSFAYAGERLKQINGHLSAQGKVLQGEQELGPRSLQTDLSWQDGHFQCTAMLVGAKGGQASLQLTSEQEAAFAWPDSGRINLEVSGLSLTALETLLPQDIEVDGSINGSAIGEWGHGRAIDLNGQIQLLNTHIGWSSEDGQIRLPLKDAFADWQWSGDNLKGKFAVNLTDQGHLEGTWQLPLPARIPTAIDPFGPLRVSVAGKMQAVGILSAFGPWLFQDIHGESDVDIAAQGTWEKPDLSGRISLSNGGAYLPIAGIQLKDIQLQSELAGDKLKIDQLTMHSGAGSLTGQGEVLFDRWQLSGYRLQITGKDFLVVDFPELQMTCNPDLVLSGTLDRLSIQGSALIPKLAIRGSKGQPEVLTSKDVVLQKSENKRQQLGFETDIQVIVDLGDDVTIVSEGVDTRLAGGAVVTMGPTGELRAQGEIQLVSGSYRAHGANLQIRQGVLSYKGGVITNPGLRIFAAREVGEVLAGVQITGTAEAPVVSLYSRPAMPERDILGYMLMGRAVNKESQESDMLMMGAGSLLPGYGGLLSDLGITDIDIQGLFTGTGGLRLRRKFAEDWEVESTLGTESGIDLYYIIEFD
ncbi:MAG: translocation/assembly module TamB domain-containing protein [Desulfuromonadales bacterium]